MNSLTEWQNFYVIVGSSAGGLIGLQFVVMALIADMPFKGEQTQAVTAFSTPSIVHFGAVLLLAATIAMPWHGLAHLALIWGAVGSLGVGYTAFTGWRLRTQTSYPPVAEDWIFRVVLPLLLYVVLASAWYVESVHARDALFLVAAVALSLLFIGIHHAWDNATYLVFVKRRELE